MTYDPDNPPTIEFSRLNRELEIEKYDTESNTLWKEFGKAMAAQFGIKFGKNVNGLRDWQRLCKRIGIELLPTTLEDARAVSTLPLPLVPSHIEDVGRNSKKPTSTLSNS